MRIRVANEFWYRRGGLERVVFDEIAWPEAAGHETAHFSTRHPENDPSPWSDYFVPYLELGAHGSLTPRERASAAGRMFWNREAARRFACLLRAFRPNIVHVHGIHRQLSPSILAEARRAAVPGRTSKAGDDGNLRRQLQRALDDRPALQDEASHAAATVLEACDWDAVAEATLGDYQTTLELKGEQ